MKSRDTGYLNGLDMGVRERKVSRIRPRLLAFTWRDEVPLVEMGCGYINLKMPIRLPVSEWLIGVVFGPDPA